MGAAAAGDLERLPFPLTGVERIELISGGGRPGECGIINISNENFIIIALIRPNMDQPVKPHECAHDHHEGAGGVCAPKCRCPHHKMVPLFIILIGLVFLAKGLGWLAPATADLLWPIGLVLVGLQKILGGLCKCCCQK